MTALCDIPKRWRRVVNPFAEPIHRDECKKQASLPASVTDFDADFDRWISAARQLFEEQAEVALLTQTWELVMDRFPGGSEPLDLMVPPVRGLASIQYEDANGVPVLADEDDFLKDFGSFPGQISPLYGAAWPIARTQPRSVVIQFRNGSAAPATADATANTLTVRPNDFANGDVVRLMASGGSLPAPLAAKTDYYVVGASGNTIQLAATAGGSAIDLTDAGSGQILVGEVPDMALQAIRFLVGHFWRTREAVTDLSMIETPLAWQHLVAGCRWR